MGLSLSGLDLLAIRMVLGIWTEKGNDSAGEDSTGGTVRAATQEDFDRFR